MSSKCGTGVSPPTRTSWSRAEADSLLTLPERFSNGGACLRNRLLCGRNAARHTIEVVDHSCMADVAHRHASARNSIGVCPTLIAQWVEFCGMDMRRRQAGEVPRTQRRDANILQIHL